MRRSCDAVWGCEVPMYSDAGRPYATPEEIADYERRGTMDDPVYALQESTWDATHPFTGFGTDQYGRGLKAPADVQQWVEATPENLAKWDNAPLQLNGHKQIKPAVMMVNGKRLIRNADHYLAMYRDPEGRAYQQARWQGETLPKLNLIPNPQARGAAIYARTALDSRINQWAQPASPPPSNPPPSGGTRSSTFDADHPFQGQPAQGGSPSGTKGTPATTGTPVSNAPTGNVGWSGNRQWSSKLARQNAGG